MDAESRDFVTAPTKGKQIFYIKFTSNKTTWGIACTATAQKRSQGVRIKHCRARARKPHAIRRQSTQTAGMLVLPNL